MKRVSVVYINPVAGKDGCEGAEYPLEMSREQVIRMACESTIGFSNGIEESFDNHLEWLEEEGNQKIDFRFDDLALDELEVLDAIVFTCSSCGWNCSIDEKCDIDGDAYCDQCAED